MKYYLEKKGFGKHFYYVSKPATGNKLKQLENSGEPLFDSRKEALEHAQSKKRN